MDPGSQALRQMLAASRQPVVACESRQAPLAEMAVFGGMARPRIVEVNGVLLAAAGHPRLRGGDGVATDLAALALAIQARGKNVLSAIGGDFSLAAWDTRSQRGLLAVDRIGVHQLVYARVGDALAYASTLDMLRTFPGVRTQLSTQGLFDYLYYHVCPGPQTIFTDLLRLAPGHCIEFGAGGASQPSAYWNMRFIEAQNPNPEALEREFVSLLETAVKE